MDTYRNNGGYFIGNNYAPSDFGASGNTKTYTLINGKWVVTHKGDDWVNFLPSAGGKLLVGSKK